MEFFSVSGNPGIKQEDVINNPNLPWEKDRIQSNPNMTLQFIKNYVGKIEGFHLFSNPSFTIEEIVENFGWKGFHLSGNPNLRVEHLKKNPNAGWCFEFVSGNKFKFNERKSERKEIKKEIIEIIKCNYSRVLEELSLLPPTLYSEGGSIFIKSKERYEFLQSEMLKEN